MDGNSSCCGVKVIIELGILPAERVDNDNGGKN
jgi:hypothetical protein